MLCAFSYIHISVISLRYLTVLFRLLYIRTYFLDISQFLFEILDICSMAFEKPLGPNCSTLGMFCKCPVPQNIAAVPDAVTVLILPFVLSIFSVPALFLDLLELSLFMPRLGVLCKKQSRPP